MARPLTPSAKRSVLALFALTPLVCACSIVDIEGLVLEGPASGIVVGDTVRLRLVARDGTDPPATSVRWESADSSVATVDEMGVVTGTGPGWVRIEARTGDYRLGMDVLVLEAAGPFVSIGMGNAHGCALTEEGRAWCWGLNEDGQLGNAASPDRCPISRDLFLVCSAAAIPVVTEQRFTRIVAGTSHNCGLTATGAAHCWGSNVLGQLGDGGNVDRATPVPVAGDHVFRSLTAGGWTTCGITVDDALLCWGDLVRVAVPTPVATEDAFALVETSGPHACALTLDGATLCWGRNSHGQLGVSSDVSTCPGSPCMSEPYEVAAPAPFLDLALGNEFSCGSTAAGETYCWGGNEHGQLGDGKRTDRWEPMPVAGGHVLARLAASAGRACGLDGEDLLHCWGQDGAGFGNGGERMEVDRPVPAAGGLSFTEVTVGSDAVCGLAASGLTWCWGRNTLGTLGNGWVDRFNQASTPTRVVRYPGI